MRRASILILLLSVAVLTFADKRADNGLIDQIEIGKVKWGRDLEAALAEPKKTGRPVFVLFQEVPG